MDLRLVNLLQNLSAGPKSLEQIIKLGFTEKEVKDLCLSGKVRHETLPEAKRDKEMFFISI